jgi:hypothetical protein
MDRGSIRLHDIGLWLWHCTEDGCGCGSALCLLRSRVLFNLIFGLSEPEARVSGRYRPVIDLHG